MNRAPFFISTALLAVIWGWGCDSDKPEIDPHAETDSLWRQGYGFNNPNVERIRNGGMEERKAISQALCFAADIRRDAADRLPNVLGWGS